MSINIMLQKVLCINAWSIWQLSFEHDLCTHWLLPLSQKRELLCACFEYSCCADIIFGHYLSNSAHICILFKCAYFWVSVGCIVITHVLVLKLHKIIHFRDRFDGDFTHLDVQTTWKRILAPSANIAKCSKLYFCRKCLKTAHCKCYKCTRTGFARSRQQ